MSTKPDFNSFKVDVYDLADRINHLSTELLPEAREALDLFSMLSDYPDTLARLSSVLGVPQLAERPDDFGFFLEAYITAVEDVLEFLVTGEYPVNA